MGYSDWTYDLLIEQFNLSIRSRVLSENFQPVSPDPWLVETLERYRDLALISDKARSEFIIAPMLSFVRTLLKGNHYLFSGIKLIVDAASGLNGECDFIIGKSNTTMPVLTSALFGVVTLAKRQDFDQAIAQCAAQLIAAKKFNEKRLEAHRTVYGCVTTGSEWQFLRLRDQELSIDKELLPLGSIEQILGVLVSIAKGSENL